MPSARFASRAIALRKAIVMVLCVVLAVVGMLAQTTSKTPPAKKTVAQSASKRSPAKNVKVSLSKPSVHARGAVSHDEASNSARAISRKVVVTRKLVHGHWVRTTQIVHADPGPTYQTHPDTERYQQIQQALAQKGYFKGEANGQWNDDSVAALRQFQTDQKINNDGKISSLSLIGLGLGPNRETASAKADPSAQD